MCKTKAAHIEDILLRPQILRSSTVTIAISMSDQWKVIRAKNKYFEVLYLFVDFGGCTGVGQLC